MSSFTMNLPDAINFLGGKIVTGEDGEFILTGDDVGLTHYPIFDESYRQRLNTLIVSNFYNREIAHETPLIWRNRLRTKMSLIMPTYNKLYLSTEIDYDPLSTIDVRSETVQKASTLGEALANAKAESESSAGGRTINSDFPQMQLNDYDDYATNGSDNINTGSAKSDSTNTSETKGTEEGESTSHTKGYQGVAANLILAYRQSLINVDQMILDELEPLFFALWSTRESRTTQESAFYMGGMFPFYPYR